MLEEVRRALIPCSGNHGDVSPSGYVDSVNEYPL